MPTLLAPYSPMGALLGKIPLTLESLAIETPKRSLMVAVHYPQDLLWLGRLEAATPLLGTHFLWLLFVSVSWLQHWFSRRTQLSMSIQVTLLLSHTKPHCPIFFLTCSNYPLLLTSNFEHTDTAFVQRSRKDTGIENIY